MGLGRRAFLDGATAVASLSAVGACATNVGSEQAIPGFRLEMPTPERVTMKTREGECPGYLFKPNGRGPWPAAIFLIDGFGVRPNVFEMAQRLADGGYLVLMPDLFYRHGRYEPLDVRAIFASGDLRNAVRELLGESPDIPMVIADADAFLLYLRDHPNRSGDKVGVTGYCMSGGMSLAIAGAYPDEIAAAACFHGGRLVSDSDQSPHRFAPAIKAQVYVAGAETDQWCPPEMVAELDRVLTAAGVNHRSEIYAGTLHGWTMRDSPLYNEAAAERHWRELFALFRVALTH